MIDAKKYSPAVYDKPPGLKKGSAEYYEWWQTHIKRCYDGYKPHGGSRITGAHYFYINFCKIDFLVESTDGSSRKSVEYPLYRDMDNEYFTEVENAEKGEYGLIVLKARRKGFSFMNANLLLHEWTLYPTSSVGVGAQTDKFVQDFRDKVLITYNRLPEELRNRWTINNKALLMGGYKTKIKGIEVTKGTGSKIHFRVADKPDVFRGLSLKKMIFEEAGEFVKLEDTFFSNLECFRDGGKQYGVPIIGGTSNMISHENPEFIQMFKHPEKYNLKPLFFSASRGYGTVYPFFDAKTGTSVVEEAKKDVLRRREEEKAKGDKKLYYSFLQEMPLVPEDAYLMLGTSPFDIEKLDKQLTKIAQNKYLKIVHKGTLEWPTNREGKQIFGSKPVFMESKTGWLSVIDGGHPLIGYKNAHVSGVDPYHVSDDLDEKKVGKKPIQNTERSKGSMCVFRKYISPHEVGDLPVAFYTDRPYSKEDFYENCAKIAIYYDTQILVENNDDGFLQYFTINQVLKGEAAFCRQPVYASHQSVWHSHEGVPEEAGN